MTSDERVQALVELGDHVTAVLSGMPRAWQLVRGAADNAVSLDKFSIQCATAAQALGTLADRARELAGDLLDGDD